MRTEISCFSDLRKLRNSNENDEFILTDNIVLGSDYVPDFVENFIISWLFPIDEFNGVLDGNGYKIDSFSYEGPEEISLIKNNKGTIKNLELDNVDIKSKKTASGIVLSNYGKIKNCTVCGIVESKFMASGIAGKNIKGDVIGCDFDGCISLSNFAGGIVGENGGLVKNCHSSGTYNIPGTAGGISFINLKNGIIRNCSSEVVLITTSKSPFSGGPPSGNPIGGLVGDNQKGATVEDSYFVGSLFIGRKSGMLVGNNIGCCKNCYYMGDGKCFGYTERNVGEVGAKDSVDDIKNSIIVGKI